MDQNVVVVKKKSTFWKVVKIALLVAGVCFVAARIYRKYFQKKEEALEEAEELAALEEAEDLAVSEEEEEVLDVPAEAVIVNAEDME